MPSGQTSGDVIKGALRLIGAIATGQTPTADESNDGLIALNDLNENWSLQGLAVYGTQDLTFATVANQAMYTIGPTGNWVTTRPVRIEDDPYCTIAGIDFPIKLVGQPDYDSIALKSQPGQIIEQMLFVNDTPNARLTMWPVPNSVINVTLNIDTVLPQVPNLVTVMTFPPGYLLAFRYALAILLAPDYGRSVPPEVLAVAASSMAAIKKANIVRRSAKFDPALYGGDGPVTYQRGF